VHLNRAYATRYMPGIITSIYAQKVGHKCPKSRHICQISRHICQIFSKNVHVTRQKRPIMSGLTQGTSSREYPGCTKVRSIMSSMQCPSCFRSNTNSQSFVSWYLIPDWLHVTCQTHQLGHASTNTNTLPRMSWYLIPGCCMSDSSAWTGQHEHKHPLFCVLVYHPGLLLAHVRLISSVRSFKEYHSGLLLVRLSCCN
jgi:hypothetical protein